MKKWNFEYKASSHDNISPPQISKSVNDSSFIDALCTIAEEGNIQQMREYIKKYSEEHSDVKDVLINNTSVIYPYNVAFNSYQYEFATVYQDTITELLGKDVFHEGDL